MNANHLKEYFNFSKKERTGIVALLLLIIIAWVFPYFLNRNDNITEKEELAFKQEVAAFKASQLSAKNSHNDAHDTSSELSAKREPPTKSSLFYFDPNTLSPAGWQQLGLRDRTITTIKNYISKGGRFRKADDLKKIFGLRKEEYDKLLPYVKIEQGAREMPGQKNADAVVAHQQSAQKFKELIDVNNSDTSAFIKLPGIGSKLAARIVSFRNKLGGFYAISQVAEVYGVDDTVFQKIKTLLVCPDPHVRKLNINTVTLDSLKAHPYIKYQIANAVIQYRTQHGRFRSVTDVKEVHLVTEELLQKILPYISVD